MPTNETLEMNGVLRKWEKAAHMSFRETVRAEYADRMVTLYHCGECDYSMFIPVLAGSRDFYADIMTSEDYIADKWEFFRAIRDIKRHRSQNILDVGCGNGHFLTLLRQKIPGVYCAGYELNQDMAEIARSRGHHVSCGPFPQAVFDMHNNQPFDVVCAFQVLEHLSDPVAFLQNVKHLLRPGGLFYVSVPDLAGPIRHFKLDPTNIPPHHVSWWTATTFRQGIARMGFEIFDMAKEPLPAYLWDFYLPVMLERDAPFRRIWALFNHYGITQKLIRLLKLLSLKELPGVPGHTLYVGLKVTKT